MPFIVIAMPVTMVSAVTPAIVPVSLMVIMVIVVIGKGWCHCHGTDHQGEGECQQGLAEYQLALPNLFCRGFHRSLPFFKYIKPLLATNQWFLLLPWWWCP